MSFILFLPDSEKFNAYKNSHAICSINPQFRNIIIIKLFDYFLLINISTNLLNPGLFSFDCKVLFNGFLSSFSKFVPFVHICHMRIYLGVVFLKLNFGYFCMAIEFCRNLLMIDCVPFLGLCPLVLFLDGRSLVLLNIDVKNYFLFFRLQVCLYDQFFLFFHWILKIRLLFILPVKTAPHLLWFIIILKLQCSSHWPLMKWWRLLKFLLVKTKSGSIRNIVPTIYNIWSWGFEVWNFDIILSGIWCLSPVI
jgi:hypothetical protein